MLVPEWLADEVVERKRTLDLGHPALDQEVFARFAERAATTTANCAGASARTASGGTR